MDKELKAKWVSALRSGEYQQLVSPGSGNWREAGKHCCLGVLGELLGRQSEMDAKNFRKHCSALMSEDTIDELVAMNDSGKSFSEIADYVSTKL